MTAYRVDKGTRCAGRAAANLRDKRNLRRSCTVRERHPNLSHPVRALTQGADDQGGRNCPPDHVKIAQVEHRQIARHIHGSDGVEHRKGYYQRSEVREDLQQSTREKNIKDGDPSMVEERNIRTNEQQYAATEMTEKQ